jgi:hypothetical protein
MAEQNFRAWTGGSGPKPLAELAEAERRLVSRVFRRDMLEWAAHWGRAVPLDVARTFWGRARYDAHATLRPNS